MKKTLFVISIFVFFIKIVKCYFCGSEDWVAFEDEKCFKFVNRVVTYEEAEQICNNQAKGSLTLNFLPTLVSIKSQEKQKFLERYLFETSGAFDSVWISAQSKTDNETNFEWNDGSELEYNNWADGYPTNNTDRKCVQMQSEYNLRNSTNFIKSSTVGKWVNIPCQKSNLVVCEKLQAWSFSQLQKTLLDIRNNLRQNPVPIGFIYVQLPGQPETKTIWPQVEWVEVSKEYAGLFFRTVGGNSAEFDKIQEEDFKTFEANYCNGCDADTSHVAVPKNGQWSDKFLSGRPSNGGSDYMTFRYTDGEVRPRNKAVRIWKRVK